MALDDALRYLGLLLQVLGLGTTALGIADVRRRFTNRPGVLAAARGRLRPLWLRADRVVRRLRGLPPRTWTVAKSLTTGWAVMRPARPRLRDEEPPEAASLEERVARLEWRSMETRARVREVSGDLAKEEKSRVHADRAEGEQRERADRELRGLVRELAAGGLRLQTWGVVAFLVGEVLAGLDRELAALLRWLL